MMMVAQQAAEILGLHLHSRCRRHLLLGPVLGCLKLRPQGLYLFAAGRLVAVCQHGAMCQLARLHKASHSSELGSA